jgi:hypothetical protein
MEVRRPAFSVHVVVMRSATLLDGAGSAVITPAPPRDWRHFGGCAGRVVDLPSGQEILDELRLRARASLERLERLALRLFVEAAERSAACIFSALDSSARLARSCSVTSKPNRTTPSIVVTV